MKLKILIPAIVLSASAAIADTTYDNQDKFNEFGDVSLSMTHGSPTIGEVFTTPDVDSVMTDFHFYFGQGVSPTNGLVYSYLGFWSGTEASVYTTFQPSTLFFSGHGADLSYSFNAFVPANTQMIAFVSVSPDSPPFQGSANMLLADIQQTVGGPPHDPNFNSGPDSIPGGALVVLNNGSDTSQFGTGNWINLGATTDAIFHADFVTGTATPEPESIFLVGTALVACGLFRRKYAK